MARRCQLSSTKGQNGNRVSHANNKTHHVFGVNLQRKRVWVPELGKFVRVRVSVQALRSIDRLGLMGALKRYGVTLDQVKA